MAWTGKARTDLSVIKLYYEKTFYNIDAEEFSMERKQEKNERIACNSHIPYEVNYGQEEYSFELKGIRESQRWIFEHILDRQSKGTLTHMPVIAIYKYKKDGKLQLDYHWKSCSFDDIKQDKNEPFDVSGNSYEPIKVY